MPCRRLEPSSSGLVFLWGMRRSFPELTVNNILFSPDYPAEFRQIFEEGSCPEEPTVYVNITSKVTPADAPAGGENWFVLVNAPCNTGQDWASQVRQTRERVLRRLEQALGRGVEGAIAAEQGLTPADIERDTGSRLGSLYGISSNTPLAVLSGKIASDLVRRHQPLSARGAPRTLRRRELLLPGGGG
jgi:diapolycopene oxygenase